MTLPRNACAAVRQVNAAITLLVTKPHKMRVSPVDTKDTPCAQTLTCCRKPNTVKSRQLYITINIYISIQTHNHAHISQV